MTVPEGKSQMTLGPNACLEARLLLSPGIQKGLGVQELFDSTTHVWRFFLVGLDICQELCFGRDGSLQVEAQRCWIPFSCIEISNHSVQWEL